MLLVYPLVVEICGVPFEETDIILNRLSCLYSCLRYGKSIRKDGSPVPAPPLRDSVDWRTIQNIWDGPLEGSDESLQHAGLSKTTSWLPTDFTVSEDGKHLKALSYINNVHPLAHAKLQDVLVELLEAFLPMFERTAGDLTSYIDGFPRLFGDEQSELDDSTRPVDPKTGEPIESWNDEEDEDDERWETWLETLPYIDPKPKPYEPLASPLGSGFRLNGRTIQVIVKVAEMSVFLTPLSQSKSKLSRICTQSSHSRKTQL